MKREQFKIISVTTIIIEDASLILICLSLWPYIEKDLIGGTIVTFASLLSWLIIIWYGLQNLLSTPKILYYESVKLLNETKDQTYQIIQAAIINHFVQYTDSKFSLLFLRRHMMEQNLLKRTRVHKIKTFLSFFQENFDRLCSLSEVYELDKERSIITFKEFVNKHLNNVFSIPLSISMPLYRSFKNIFSSVEDFHNLRKTILLLVFQTLILNSPQFVINIYYFSTTGYSGIVTSSFVLTIFILLLLLYIRFVSLMNKIKIAEIITAKYTTAGVLLLTRHRVGSVEEVEDYQNQRQNLENVYNESIESLNKDVQFQV